jgi:hypothetical protein
VLHAHKTREARIPDLNAASEPFADRELHPRGDPKEVKRILREEKVTVTLRELDAEIRVSVVLFNNRSDVTNLPKALSKME